MRKKIVISLLILAAVTISFGLNEANAGFPLLPPLPGLPAPDVSVHVNGYLPAPPGVHVRIDSGRPYYVERDRRVYIERERPRYYKKRHYERERRYYEHNDRGRGHGRGHDRHDD